MSERGCNSISERTFFGSPSWELMFLSHIAFKAALKLSRFVLSGNTINVEPPDTEVKCVVLVFKYFSSVENDNIIDAGRWVLPGKSLITAPTVILYSLLYLNVLPIGFSFP